MKALAIGGAIAIVLAALYYFGTHATARPDKVQVDSAVTRAEGRAPSPVGRPATAPSAPKPVSPADSRRVDFDQASLAQLPPTDSRRQMVADFEAFVAQAKLTRDQRSRLLALYLDLATARKLASDADFWNNMDLFRELGPERAQALREDPHRESLLLNAVRDLRDEADRRAREILDADQYEIYRYTLLGSAAHLIAEDLPLTVSP